MSNSAWRNTLPRLRTLLLVTAEIMAKATTAAPPMAMAMGAPITPMLAKALACNPPNGRMFQVIP